MPVRRSTSVRPGQRDGQRAPLAVPLDPADAHQSLVAEDLPDEQRAIPAGVALLEDVTAVRRRSEIPASARRYVERLEGLLGLPVKTISVGPDREQTIIG